MKRFTIRPNEWFAWQMFPGYAGLPYTSPIYVRGFQPLKTGDGLFRLQFINVFYAKGVKDMDMELRVLSRQHDFLLAALIDDPGQNPDRFVVISEIGFEWIERFCPQLWSTNPPAEELRKQPDGVASYLDGAFFPGQFAENSLQVAEDKDVKWDQSLLYLVSLRAGLAAKTVDSSRAFQAWGRWASEHDWYPVAPQEVLKVLVDLVAHGPDSDQAIQGLPIVLLQPALFALNRWHHWAYEGGPGTSYAVAAAKVLDRLASRNPGPAELRPIFENDPLRRALVATALAWEERTQVAPRITSEISEYDAARLIGIESNEVASAFDGMTAVTKGHDFKWQGIRYQVKANRPSGKKGSFVTMVGKANNYHWDVLIWILYDREWQVCEAWSWQVADYKRAFEDKKKLTPDDMRQGTRIF